MMLFHGLSAVDTVGYEKHARSSRTDYLHKESRVPFLNSII